MSVTEKETAIRSLSTIISSAQGVLLGLLAVADDLAAKHGARNIPDWHAATLHLDHRTASSTVKLAKSLDARHPHLRAALLDGRVHLDAARVLAFGLDDLPAEVGAELLGQAEEHLISEAARFTPAQLRILCRKVLEVMAPEKFDDHERRALEAEERRAAQRTFLRFRPNGDGTTRITGRLPDAAAHRLRTYLHAHTAPRRGAGLDHPDAALPHTQRLGHAFVELLENLPAQTLPIHGGTTTSVVVTMTLADLLGDRAATLDNGDRISPGDARRLACQAGIIPAVLGSRSEVLDLGRTQRLFNTPQRKALMIRDRVCRAEGCTIAASWCEAHHTKPWSHGGRTDLKDGVLLCNRHHHIAHDPAYETTRLPSGDYRFHRRT